MAVGLPLRAGAVLTAAVCAAVLLVAGAPPASAHAVLIATQPERGTTVTEQLDAVSLQFSEAVSFAQVQVTGPDGERVEEGTPDEQGEAVSQPLGPVLEQGTYRVAFRVTSDDGHPVEGQFEFAYAGPVGTGGTDDPPSATEETPLPDGAEDPEVAADERGVEDAGLEGEAARDVDLGAPVLIVALLVLVGLAGGAALAVRRRGGSAGGQESPDEAA